MVCFPSSILTIYAYTFGENRSLDIMKPSFALIRLYLSIAICFFTSRVESGALPLTNSNFDTILATHELVFINFYADWCRFSNMLAPVFDDAADKLAMELPEGGKAIMAKVDCDQETSIASRFHITKYPTLKMIRNGQVAKKEYRGQRSTQAFVDYIKEQLADPIKEYKSVSELNNLDDKKRIIIGYFEQKGTPEYENFRKIASNLKDDCSFYAGFGDASRAMHPPGQDIVAFRPAKARSNENDETFTGNMKTFDELSIWITEKCLPLVREITFENAEELTEEGLPFLILFYDPDDLSSIKTFNDVINKELLDEKQNINFLTADGSTFAHPLQHLGKSKKDLPLIAIDSFRHMYLFPDYQDIHKPGKLKQFLSDLHSGKLHREFHYGPDPVTEAAHAIEHKPHGAVPANQVNLTPQGQEQGGTSPPESTFKKLAPSKNRYTLLNPRDEL